MIERIKYLLDHYNVDIVRVKIKNVSIHFSRKESLFFFNKEMTQLEIVTNYNTIAQVDAVIPNSDVTDCNIYNSTVIINLA